MAASIFANAEVAPHKFLRSLRDFGYAVTLANPISALTQVKDVGMSAYVNGLIPTLKSVFGKKNVPQYCTDKMFCFFLL